MAIIIRKAVRAAPPDPLVGAPETGTKPVLVKYSVGEPLIDLEYVRRLARKAAREDHALAMRK